MHRQLHFGDFSDGAVKLILIDDARVGQYAALPVVLDSEGNIKLTVHLTQLFNQCVNQFGSGIAGQMDKPRNVRIALGSLRIFGVKTDHFGQVHRVGCAMNNMPSAVCGAGFMGHGVDDAKQSV